MLTILDALDAPVAILTADERLEWVNVAGSQWLGSSLEELAGQPFVQILPSTFSLEVRQRFATTLGRACAGEASDLEHAGRRISVLPFGGGCVVVLARASRAHDGEALAAIGHDLRTPLLNLSLAANVLAQSGNDTASDVAELVAEAGQRLQRLTRDLVDFTRSRLHLARAPSRRPVDLPALIRAAAASLEATFPKAQIAIEARGTGIARLDPDQTLQLLQNLLLHGLKNRKPRSPVRVTTSIETERVEIEMHVEGTSVHDERSFELELVRSIAVAHDGAVDVLAGDAGGTRFAVRIPLTAPSESLDHAADSR